MQTKKSIFCNNCGKYNHEFKECREPVTSYGIILIDFNKEIDIYKQQFLNYIKKQKKIELNNYGIKINSFSEMEKFSKYADSIKFLMIQRKHTLGYIEFIRGRYKIDNIDGLVYLFQQMIPAEIENIAKYDFDKLWHDFWGNHSYSTMKNEYDKAKEKFNILKNEEDELSLNFYVNNVIPAWNQAEWGFPKGRRNKQEDSLICAKREFQEETDFKEDEYTVFENISPIIEDFIGTNGVRYRHVYYLAINNNNNKKIEINNNNEHQVSEIGNINFVNYNNSIKLIRPYHVAKKKVVNIIYTFILDTVINNSIFN